MADVYFCDFSLNPTECSDKTPRKTLKAGDGDKL